MISRRRSPPIRLRRLSLIAAALSTATALACDDPFEVKATLAVQTDTLVAFALSGTSPIFPAALNTVFRSVVRVDADHNYDVAFDLDAQGSVKVIPVRLMGGATTATRRVGIQKAKQSFESLTSAPTSGYVYDSIAVIKTGEALALELTSTDQCVYSYSSLLYSKIGIDSVNATTRQIFFRVTHDPNCGFRSFLPGVPKN